jgi:ATP/maltotriose-dependent transcriptional regulator MalT
VHARIAGDRFEEREIVEWLAIALLLGPTPAEEAAQRCRELIEAAAHNRLQQAEVTAVLGTLEAMLGRPETAKQLTAQVRETTDALGEWIWIAAFWHALVLIWQDDPAEAERELRPSYEALRTLGEKSHFTSITHALSQALYDQGRYDEAEQLTRECAEASLPNDVYSQISWRAIRAMVLARRGEFDAAERLGREAVAFAEGSDFLVAHAEALVHLGEVLALRGDAAGARDALAAAVRLHEQKGNVLAAERARLHLAKLFG